MNYLRIHEPRVPSQLADCGGAGTGCGWCVPFLKRYFQESRDGEGLLSVEPSADEYAMGRGSYIQSGQGCPPPGATPPPHA